MMRLVARGLIRDSPARDGKGGREISLGCPPDGFIVAAAQPLRVLWLLAMPRSVVAVPCAIIDVMLLETR
jgi:hypothetical protein